MKLKEITSKLELTIATKFFDAERTVSGAYTSDLLSDVIANVKKDNLWVTLQTHVNIAAVATLKEITAIIIVLNKDIDKDTLEKAESEKITILRTVLNAYQVSGKLYELGIR
jgi:hypothetical protein